MKNTMPQIVILFGKRSWKNDVFNNMNSKTVPSYENFYTATYEQKIGLYRASYTWFDETKQIFSHAWTYVDGHWKRVHNIKPDLIYDKTKNSIGSSHIKSKLVQNFKFINDMEFNELLSNKLFTSLIFPEYSKKHFKIQDKKQLNKILTHLHTQKIVLKQTFGCGGDDVHICNKNNLPPNITFPILVQEFIDSSAGIPDITPSTHDLRLAFVDDELIYSNVKVPAPGKLRANLSQGGSMTTIQPENLPASLHPLIETVKERFKCFIHKIYTIDIMFDENQRPWIIEMNSMPGLYFSDSQKHVQDQFYKAIINIFKQLV